MFRRWIDGCMQHVSLLTFVNGMIVDLVLADAVVVLNDGFKVTDQSVDQLTGALRQTVRLPERLV